MYLAQNLKYLREQKGMKQQELAGCLGVEQRTISWWECGNRTPDIETIVKLAKYYGVSLDDLILKDMRPSIPMYAVNIMHLRKRNGMTQNDFAKLLNVTASAISKYESGKIEPTLSQIMVIADFFGVTMDQIIKHDLSKEVIRYASSSDSTRRSRKSK